MCSWPYIQHRDRWAVTENKDLGPARSFVLPFLSGICFRAVHYVGALPAGNHTQHGHFRTHAKKEKAFMPKPVRNKCTVNKMG